MPDDDWDDWIALLHDDDDTELVDKTRLVDRLGPPFAAHHRHGKDLVKHAFIPVVHHTRQLHDAIQDDIFPRRAHGLALLDEASLRVENAARRDMNAAETHALDALFSTLDDLVRQSDLLFQTFKTAMHEHGTPIPVLRSHLTPLPPVQRLRRCTDQMPVDAERLIATLDKKARHLGAEDHAKAKENLLRGILEKY
ncbi:hypothetical protein OG21DRAFT_1480408 [Imleria badia]|nr:hypothetical protein OG21DRAFT_1480408 [Imleria badia]